MKDAFSKLHPTVNFIFFAFVLVLSMFVMNPVCLALSLVCAFVNAVYLNGIKTVKLCLKFIMPMMLLIILINPVFNHQGVTILTYFPWDNPLTLESIVYGIASAALLSSVVLWFSVFNRVITSDKLVYLFGRIIPSLSLVLSMSLRFVPKFSAQFKNVRNAQRCIGRDISDCSVINRIKNGIRIISIMLSWSMENAIETADSMKSRGFGLKGRTAYSIYRFDRRDLIVLIIVALLGVTVSVSAITGVIDFNYYPSIKGNLTDALSLATFFLYGILMLIPTILNAGEGIKWKRLRSAI
ncbi:energy-coupling factor transporter transmembrane component T [Ruminococcus sp.]|uniref:energy-coupling factor transporter transmembrane component T n=1 Tax=Ruminococcus sp. TaxID=41978 RepID=UPI002621A2C1|nr:energy-coupling factor transporter transmembrane component T [Ruminococcus sp.]MDD6989123.1 energy-coupling factor transporter transmembrane component T [Ruminococcus sp.]MDY6200977.1 energy-coupling factor transporter transmembrane component T [Ruminococcus sp.]